MTDADDAAATDRRARLMGFVVALLVAVAAGSAFWALSLPGADDAGDTVAARSTERALVTLPQPEDTPEPVDEHFPAIDGLAPAEADDTLVAGLEQQLRPPDGDFADSRHRELRDGDEAVAIISLLRADGDEDATVLRQAALDGFGELFSNVGDGEVADEAVMRARTADGAALLWLPDTVSVVVVTAVSDERAEAVLGEVVTAVRGEPDDTEQG